MLSATTISAGTADATVTMTKPYAMTNPRCRKILLLVKLHCAQPATVLTDPAPWQMPSLTCPPPPPKAPLPLPFVLCYPPAVSVYTHGKKLHVTGSTEAIAQHKCCRFVIVQHSTSTLHSTTHQHCTAQHNKIARHNRTTLHSMTFSRQAGQQVVRPAAARVQEAGWVCG